MITNAMMEIAQAVKNARSIRRMMKPNMELTYHSRCGIQRILTDAGWAVARPVAYSLLFQRF